MAIESNGGNGPYLGEALTKYQVLSPRKGPELVNRWHKPTVRGNGRVSQRSKSGARIQPGTSVQICTEPARPTMADAISDLDRSPGTSADRCNVIETARQFAAVAGGRHRRDRSARVQTETGAGLARDWRGAERVQGFDDFGYHRETRARLCRVGPPLRRFSAGSEACMTPSCRPCCPW
jgi:hypothetical protein